MRKLAVGGPGMGIGRRRPPPGRQNKRAEPLHLVCIFISPCGKRAPTKLAIDPRQSGPSVAHHQPMRTLFGLMAMMPLVAAFSTVLPPSSAVVAPRASAVAPRASAPLMLSAHRHNVFALRMVLSRDESNAAQLEDTAEAPKAVEDVPGNAYLTDKPSEDPTVTCYMTPDSKEDEKPEWICTDRAALGNAGDADDTY
jgi:hypothetical protein